MSDPHAPRRVSATIKYPESKRYANDNPWLVFEGCVETVREQIIEAFNMTDTDDLTLADVVLTAQQQASAVGTAASNLGGKVISNDKSGGAWAQARGEQSESKPEEKLEPTLAEIIEASETVDQHRELWLDRAAEIKSSELVDAWSAKAKALKEAAA